MTTGNVGHAKTVIFLGAGASAAEGAPVQGKLFHEYVLFERRALSHEINHHLVKFFRHFFGLDILDPHAETYSFPTFEEVLGILELADSQEEYFRSPSTGLERRHWDAAQIKRTRRALILLIAEVLDWKLRDEGSHHRRLLQNLNHLGKLERTLFLSLNYDIVIDNALLDLREEDNTGWDLDYGVNFTNVVMTSDRLDAQWHQPDPERSVLLLKLHGSLNWLYCPTCRALTLTPKEKRVCSLKWRPGDCCCHQCYAVSVPIIIPPTFFKAMSNFYLQQIWKRAEEELKQAERIVFCGYSFPDADMHVKYLLKRAEVNRTGSPPDVFIVNEHEGKTDEQRRMEKDRYLRFFRQKDRVHWTDLSFQGFAAEPQLIEDQARWQ